MKKEVGTDTREMEWVIDAAWSARGYARERRKIMTDQHSEPLSGGIGDRTESPVRSRAASRRPGVLTFAAVIIRDLTPTDVPALIDAQRLGVEETHRESERAEFAEEVQRDLERLQLVAGTG
jgi:hypothetical protein